MAELLLLLFLLLLITIPSKFDLLNLLLEFIIFHAFFVQVQQYTKQSL